KLPCTSKSLCPHPILNIVSANAFVRWYVDGITIDAQLFYERRLLKSYTDDAACKLISSCFPDLGSDILSINTEEENNFLLTMFQTKWNGPNEILLGMFYDSDDDALKWFDTSELTYKNFREGAQVEMGLLTCAKMNTSTGRWDLVNCETFAQAGTLCKTKASTQKGNPLGAPLP
uniref:CD302 molecule n=1 Tax=Leptobrachium leishanense TaxID=445787 RepID=A0A8C5PV70_9ANUR